MTHIVAFADDSADPVLAFAEGIARDVATQLSATLVPFVGAFQLPPGVVGLFAVGHGTPGAILGIDGLPAVRVGDVAASGARWLCLFGCQTARGLPAPAPNERRVLAWRESLPATALAELPASARKHARAVFAAVADAACTDGMDLQAAKARIEDAATQLNVWAIRNEAAFRIPAVARLQQLAEALVAALSIEPLER